MPRRAPTSLAVLAAPAALAAACGYPDFQFGTTGTGGAGGDTTSSTTGGAAGALPTVPCVLAPNTVECAPTEVCCFDLQTVDIDDFCGAVGTCGANHASFYCNTAADCPPNQLCCLKDQSQPNVPDFAIACQTTCSAMNEQIICTVDADCTGGEVCKSFVTGYPDYKRCDPP
jgi:hypothetical protein